MMRDYKEGNPKALKLRVDPFQRIHNLRPIIPNYYNNMYVRYPNHNHIISSYSILNPGQQQYQDLGKQYSIHSNVKKGEEEGEGEGGEEEEEEEEEEEVMVRSRWNPVAEQVRALEELYRCGTRTPSTEQIEEITAELGRYGKIEGKNVFYWFQNHKARERQKRRRDVHQQQVASKEKGFEEKSQKRAPATSICNKEVDPPIERAGVPRKSDMMTTTRRSRDSHTSFSQFPSQQHNYDHHRHHHLPIFLPQLKNATWPSQQPPPHSSSSLPNNNNNNNNNNNSNSNSNNYNTPVQLFSTTSSNNKLTPSSQLLPRTHIHREGGHRGGPTVALTLQLFPLSGQDNDHVENGYNKKISPYEDNIISCSCMLSDDHHFLPYYQFI